MTPTKICKIWYDYKDVEDVGDMRSLYNTAIKNCAEESNTEVEPAYLPDEFFKSMLKPELVPGGIPVVEYLMMEQGFTPLLFAFLSQDLRLKVKQQDMAVRDLRGPRDLKEALHIWKSDARHPPENFYMTLEMMTSYAVAIKCHFSM